MSQAMRAWARWAAGRCDLPKRLRRRLLAELENDLRDFRARRTLVDQLWAGDPPEIAEQGMRMAAGGLDRGVIFDKLMKDTSIRA